MTETASANFLSFFFFSLKQGLSSYSGYPVTHYVDQASLDLCSGGGITGMHHHTQLVPTFYRHDKTP